MGLTYKEFLKQGIDLAPLGLEQRDQDETYFCTPKGAKIIGWAGVDGIHYCFIHGFGTMVFAVTPMNVAPHYVHPLAQNFSDFLRLLLSCGGAAALDQAWQWDEEGFSAFLAGHPPTQEQQAVLTQIAQQTGLSPMENPWEYLHQLHVNFDASNIIYTEDFFDPDMNPDAPNQNQAWMVTFEGGFWRHRGRAGTELPLCKDFTWAGHHWRIPSAYLCSQGLVLDFCMQVEPSAIEAFMDAWNLRSEHQGEQLFSQQQQLQLQRDNPLQLDFTSIVHANGKKLVNAHGYGTSYNPCMGPDDTANQEAMQVIHHYGLDPHFGWVILRAAYPWATKRKPDLRRLSVTMIQDPVFTPGPQFQVQRPGDTVVFFYGDQAHTLTVQEYEAQTMDWSRMSGWDLAYPSHYIAMTYTITPELPDGILSLADCDDGDGPRQLPSQPGQPVSTACTMVMGIPGGADDSTPIPFVDRGDRTLHAACSSLHFQPVEHVEWRLMFYEKQFGDITVDLLVF